MANWWKPGQIYLDLMRDREAIVAALREVAGEISADAHTTSALKVQNVVHRHGGNEENILVVEIKLTTNRQPREYDLAKLSAFREQLQYRVGAFLELPRRQGFGGEALLD